MNIEILDPFKGVYVNINNRKFRRIWSEYDDIILWEYYDDVKSEWKPVNNDKLEILYNSTVNKNIQKELNDLLEVLKQ
jgi:hypothetical protein